MFSSKEAVQYLLEQSKKYGATDAQAISSSSCSLSSSCRMGKLENIDNTQTENIKLNVFVGHRSSTVSTNSFDKETLNGLAQRAVDMAKVLPEDPYCGLPNSDQYATEFQDFDLWDEKEYSSEFLLNNALEIEEIALHQPMISNSDGAGAYYQKTKSYLATTNGFEHENKKTKSGNSVCVLAKKDDEMQLDYSSSEAVYYSDLKSNKEIALEAADRAAKKLGAKKIDSCKADVILDRKLNRGLILEFLSAISGAAVAKGTTFLKDSLNKQVFSSNVTIEENPFIQRGLGSASNDGEGLPKYKKNLIENGILKTWLLNLRYARQLNLAPTSNGAPFGVGNSVANIKMNGGTLTPEELYSDIKYGIYITQLIGQGVNLITGDYSRGAVGFLIENGKITTPVNEITIAGNLVDMFKTMSIANDLEDRYKINVPTCRIPNMSIAGK